MCGKLKTQTRTKHRTVRYPAKGNEISMKKHLHLHVYCGTIHNHQHTKSTQVSSEDKKVKKNTAHMQSNSIYLQKR